jgi:signal transduction histidine kinase
MNVPVKIFSCVVHVMAHGGDITIVSEQGGKEELELNIPKAAVVQ